MSENKQKSESKYVWIGIVVGFTDGCIGPLAFMIYLNHEGWDWASYLLAILGILLLIGIGILVKNNLRSYIVGVVIGIPVGFFITVVVKVLIDEISIKLYYGLNILISTRY